MGTPGRPRHPDTLTPRQQHVLALLRRGLTNEEIAQELGISPDGVKYHVSEILRRLHVETRHEAAAWQPAPSRPRWAVLLAPVLAIKKLHLGALGYAAAAAITAVAAVGIALLVWGLTRTSGHSEIAPPALARTGIPAVDRAIDLLVHQDVDALIGIAQFAPIGCSAQQTVGSPPPCPAGQPDGTPVDAFPIAQCEGAYTTSTDQLRGAFGLALLRQPSAAVYAVLRDNSADRSRDSYWIAITQDRPSLATADVSFWNVAADGHVVALQNECGPVGAAQQVAYRFPVNPDFVLGPYINCSPPPGQTANFMITVDSLSPGGVLPQFWGEAQSTLGEDTGERAIVTVRPDTAWTGDINRLEDVRAGMQLEAVGVRQPDCTILAQTILQPLLPSPSAGATTSPSPSTQRYTNPAYKVELDYPGGWTADPGYADVAGVSVRYSESRDPAARFFWVGAASAPSLDYATDAVAHHILHPYGAAPTISDVSLPAGHARLILPDPASPDLTEAAAILAYPAPVQIGQYTYQYLQLDARPADIMALAQAVRFLP